MLNPDQTARFRASLDEQPDRTRFDAFHCHARPLRLQAEPAGEVVGTEAPAPVDMHGPEQVFGTPLDARCMSGIGPYRTHTPGKALRRLSDAAVIGNTAVLDGAGHLFTPEPLTPEAAPQLAAACDDYAGYVLRDAGQVFVCTHVGRPRPRPIDADALFLHSVESANYGSFLFRQLPQLMLAARLAPSFDCYVVPERTPFLLEALALLGLPERPVYTVREVCGDPFRSVTFANAFDAEGLLAGSTIEALRDLAGAVRDGAPGEADGEPIYISRRLSAAASPQWRVLVNEDAVETHMRDRGVRVCYPETTGLAQQIRLFAGARAVLGPSGSGMLNAMFAAPGVRVLDMESFHVTVRQHAKIYASTGKPYAFLFGTLAGEGAAAPLGAPWQVSVDDLAAAVEWALA